jgi:DNA-directed RNA polymerase specialized sigma24 family protein
VGKSATARSLPTAAREGHEIVLALPTVEDVLRREHVSAALAELPESERAALDLVFFDGLSVYDAAQRLGIPSHSARALIGYSMHLLRTTLRPPVPS